MSLSNDILSLKKEIKHGDIDSIVPILMYNRGFTVQEAIAVSISPDSDDGSHSLDHIKKELVGNI